MRKSILVIIILFLSLKSQSQQFVTTDDAADFLELYFSPMGESLGAGMNNGWYNTAKPHKLGGFDITLTLNSVSIPNEMQYFNPNNATLVLVGDIKSTNIVGMVNSLFGNIKNKSSVPMDPDFAINDKEHVLVNNIDSTLAAKADELPFLYEVPRPSQYFTHKFSYT